MNLMTHDELMKAASQFNENRLPVGLCSTLHQLKQLHGNETIMRVLCNYDNVNTIRVPVLLGFFSRRGVTPTQTEPVW